MQPAPRTWIFGPMDRPLPLVDAAVSHDYLGEETAVVSRLLVELRASRAFRRRVHRAAVELVERVRARRQGSFGIDALMREYDLSSKEGVVLMCLAEALLRIPDAETADRLIADKIGSADWGAHLDAGGSLFVNASTWALMLTGRILREDTSQRPWAREIAQLVNRLGEPVIRSALRQAMRVLGHQFVMGRTIEEALERADRESNADFRYSFDMLGEAALTAADAARHFEAYARAIDVIGASPVKGNEISASPSVSVKLSALSPRFEFAQSRRALAELIVRARELAAAARAADVAMTIDAEEADRLELTLAVFAEVLDTPPLRSWSGLGLAVQAYQKRAPAVLRWLGDLATTLGTRIPVRLVKGAYWDTEIKSAQALGLDDYPVFTRKASTDLSYLACADLMLAPRARFYPQFATHNAHTVAWLLERGKRRDFEFQRLHGMGEGLYREIVGARAVGRPCRVYAPVGNHEELLPYLVRRLLENGANTSFVNRIVHAELPAEDVVEDPTAVIAAHGDAVRNPRIPLPADLFGESRRNSAGLNPADHAALARLRDELYRAEAETWRAAPIIDGRVLEGEERRRDDPADIEEPVGVVVETSTGAAREAVGVAAEFQPHWDALGARERAGMLRIAADAFERHRAELVARCVREAGRTVMDSLAELREAVDLLRYYAAEAERLMAEPRRLPGVTGELNELRLRGRGVFFCVSPWNFPLSIFAGQIAAALATGNTVLAKPAEQAGLVAHRAVELMLAAGIPPSALQLLPGDGPRLGAAVLGDARVAGVVFTGSTETAAAINALLAERRGPLATLIAETGGINAMLVDSSALPEQVVKDAVQSAFNSAGQRCSALRLLCLQADTAERILAMLEGCMRELVIGDPSLLSTDVGPVIDAEAHAMLTDYVARRAGRVRFQCELREDLARGRFFPPTLIELDRARDLTREVFGPVLHVVRYRAGEELGLIEELNGLGYGLTLGIHSRIESFAAAIAARARVGNVYVNRNMIGAQVGCQPFGGMGLSGTGPKAGGPHYLERFIVEQVVTTNTAAVGGNASLFGAS